MIDTTSNGYATDTFTDKIGDSWKIEFDVGILEDLKAHEIDIDLMFKEPTKFLDLFLAKPQKLAEMFYVLCEEQIKERGLNPQQFAKRLNRETIDKATNSLIMAALSFSQRGAVGKALRTKIPQMLKELDEKIETEAMSRVSSNSPTSTPGSLESIPAG